MQAEEVFYLVAAVVAGFILAYFLQRYYVFFKRAIGILFLGVAFIVFVLLHNIISAIFKIEESIFFILAVLTPVIIVSMAIFLVVRRMIGKE